MYHTSPHYFIEKRFNLSGNDDHLEVIFPENIGKKILFMANYTVTHPSELHLLFKGLGSELKYVNLTNTRKGTYLKKGDVVLAEKPYSFSLRYYGNESGIAFGHVRLYYSSIDYQLLTMMVFLQLVTSFSGLAMIGRGLYNYRIKKSKRGEENKRRWLGNL